MTKQVLIGIPHLSKCLPNGGKPYNIDVKAVLDTEYLSLLKKGIQPCAVLVRAICPSINAEFEKRKIPVWNSRLSAGSVITKERHESI